MIENVENDFFSATFVSYQDMQKNCWQQLRHESSICQYPNRAVVCCKIFHLLHIFFVSYNAAAFLKLST